MTRILKVEETGLLRRKRVPKIRICGQWLASVGFPPASHVRVEAIAEGTIVLHSLRTNECLPTGQHSSAVLST